MAKQPKQPETRNSESAQAPEQAAQDLPVRPDDADKVKGGAIGPCNRPK